EEWIPEAEFEESLRYIPKEVIPFEGEAQTATLSVALPASIIANVKTVELKAALVGNIARCLVVMGVDEVVVYEDMADAVDPKTGRSPSLDFFIRNLQYLETPQFLRKKLFKLHPG
ncbi:DKFZp566D143.1, related, partial [Eimeria maxima]